MGSAKFLSANEIQVTREDKTTEILKTNNSIIATGASASGIPGIEVDGKKVLTYNEAILQDFVPKSAVIIGAGALGLEFATIWSGYGAGITLVEMLPRLAPLEDEEVSQELERAFKKRGIESLDRTQSSIHQSGRQRGHSCRLWPDGRENSRGRAGACSYWL